ncbi:inorganic phosphate transporter [Candidatus Roizmanbacteria bacterium]|nr:inorganic phosphate transporter [Candidatus Roizmanbacteria bacterium]
MAVTPLLLFVLALILWAEFVNGWTDAANSIATVVSTRVLSPKVAVLLATTLNIAGTFSGLEVANTIGKGIIRADMVSITTVAAAMIAIISWSTIAWKYGLPTSESHALISGLTGAGLAVAGPSALEWGGWQKVFIGLLFSTFLGFILAYLIFLSIAWIFKDNHISKIRRLFGKLQILSAAFMAFGHGSNDGQKFIGAFALTLLLGGVTSEFTVPWWVIILCAVTMGIGTSIGGWRIIRTMGTRLAKLEPQHGFAAETAAATSIEIASRFGIPLSTTHTISTAIMGVGASQGIRKIRWGVAGNIVSAWILTFPICMAISFIVAKIFLWIV